jgi:FADH2 O2-dependent halogenase
MAPSNSHDFDVIIIGGGPAGSVAASLLAQAGYRTLVLERDIHPRDHVGESLTPSTNFVFKKIGFLEKIEDAGFVRKPGACWTAPRAPIGKHVSISLGEFPPPGAFQCYTYNVERDVFDAMLLRHAAELGAKVLQGVSVLKVLFSGDRAAGVRVKVTDGWERDLSARFILDASGRSCILATQLGLKTKDAAFNQLGMFSWFKDVEAGPAGTEGMLFLHFLGLEKGWAWQIPLRNGVWSIGVVTDRADFKKAGTSHDQFFADMVCRNRTFAHYMRNARRIRPWWTQGDYTYAVTKLAGKGWMLIGDALRFVDPIFSTGVDVATYSAQYAAEAIDAVFKGADEDCALQDFEHRVSEGVEAWYDMIALFYKLQNLFTYFAVQKDHREAVVRILQGNLYQPDSLCRAREIIALMEDSYQKIMASPGNLLRPWALSAADRTGTCGTYNGAAGCAAATIHAASTPAGNGAGHTCQRTDAGTEARPSCK